MLSLISFVAIAFLAVISVTRWRMLVICGFYSFYGLLTVLNEGDVPYLGSLTPYRALYLILLISLFARFVQDHNFLLRMRRLPLLPYIFLLVLMLASSFYAHSSEVFLPDNPGGIWTRLVVLGLFWISAAHVKQKHDLYLLAGTSLVVSLTLSIWVIWNAAQLNFEAYRGGIDVNQNYVSIFVLAGAFPLIDVIFIFKSRLVKFLSLPVLLCVALAALILASRGMLVAFIFAVIVMIARAVRTLRPQTVLALGSLLVLVLAAAVLLPGGDTVAARAQSENVGTLNDRTEIWSLALMYFADSGLLRMIFGQGLWSGGHVITPVMLIYSNYHSEYLRWLMDQGIVGLLAFLVFLYFVGNRIVQCNHPLKHLMLGWITFLLLAGLSSTIADSHAFWILLGVMIGTTCLEDELRSSPQPEMAGFSRTPASTASV
jgi:O-antigen ligase